MSEPIFEKKIERFDGNVELKIYRNSEDNTLTIEFFSPEMSGYDNVEVPEYEFIDALGYKSCPPSPSICCPK